MQEKSLQNNFFIVKTIIIVIQYHKKGVQLSRSITQKSPIIQLTKDKISMNRINQYALLFGVMDNLMMYLEDNNLAKFIPKGGIYILPRSRIKRKADRMIANDVSNLVLLIEKLNENEMEANIVEQKWKSVTKATKDAKAREEYAALPFGLYLLHFYASKVKENEKLFKVHPKRIEKIFELLKKDVNFRYLDKFMLNSYQLAEIVFKRFLV